MVAGATLVGLLPLPGVDVLQAPAHAADEAAPDPNLQLAKEEFETAQTLFIKEQFEDAAGHFLGAYTHKTYPAFLFNAAVSYEKAKNFEKAKEFFQKYIDQDPKAVDAASVKTRIDAIATILAPPPGAPGAPGAGGATPEGQPGEPAQPGQGAQPGEPGQPGEASTPGAPGTPPAGTTPPAQPMPVLPAIETKGLVVIDSKPQGATIYLDNKKSGPFAQTPWQGSLPSKPVKLILEAKGFKPEERSISPRSDKLVDVYIALSEEHFLGWVEIVANVPGADVYIDSREIGAIGRTPFTGHLKPGKHVIFVERPGYLPARKEIDVLPGTATQHSITLTPGDNGWISVGGRGAYGATVSVDGKPGCSAPCRVEATPGTHRVLVTKAGFEDYEADLNVDKTAETIVEVQWSPRPSKRGAWTSAALAAAFIGGGLYVGNLSSQNRDNINADIKAGLYIDSADPRYSKGKWEAIGADVLFGVGAILAVSATVSFLSHGPDSVGVMDQRKVTLAPGVMSDGVGLGAWGRF